MTTWDRSTLAVTISFFLASFALMPLTQDRSYLAWGLLMIVAIQLSGVVARRLNIRSGMAHVVQIAMWVGLALLFGFLWRPENPDLDTFGQIVQLYRDAVIHIRTEAAPMPPSIAVRWLLVVLIGLVTVIADMLVTSLETPSWVVAPLLTLYAIPALALETDVGWLPFLMVGVAILIVLMVDGLNSSQHWTQHLSADSAQGKWTVLPALRMASLIGIPALALSLAIGFLVPSEEGSPIDGRRPRGEGPLQLTDPSIDLTKNLNLPVDRVVLEYKSWNLSADGSRTPDEDGEYLRLASLPVFDSDGWQLPTVNLTQDEVVGPVPGQEQDVTEVQVDVSMKDFGTEYLPAPYAPRNYEAPSLWAWDPESLMIINVANEDRTDAIRNTDFSVTSKVVSPVPAPFTKADAGIPPNEEQTIELPAELPDEIAKLTTQVTKGADTPALKAAAIQDYLGDPNNFDYSTDAPPGDGIEVMKNFLLVDKKGYCIHFASAMALMSRIVGIPSRVSVGFLPGTLEGDTWQVKASNMHAWPELYFEGYGWVRFEPTTAVANPPVWSQVTSQTIPEPTPTPTPSVSQSETPVLEPSSVAPSEDPTNNDEDTDSEIPWTRVALTSLAALGVLALFLLPAGYRQILRRRRLQATGRSMKRISRAWDEVRDLQLDYGYAWPRGKSPRETSALISAHLGPDAGHSMDEVSLWVERAEYSRSMGTVPDLGPEVERIRKSLYDNADWSTRVSALLLPASIGRAFRRSASQNMRKLRHMRLRR